MTALLVVDGTPAANSATWCSMTHSPVHGQTASRQTDTVLTDDFPCLYSHALDVCCPYMLYV
jgi:hypothetical protein